MKLRRNEGIRSKLCQECKLFMADGCPVQKYNSLWIKDESVLQGVATLFSCGETFVVGCKSFVKEHFLSDYFNLKNVGRIGKN